MRGILRSLTRNGVSAALAGASILALFLSQPFHAPQPLGSADGAPAVAAAPVDRPGAPSDHSAHDGDRCAQCRAFAKTRLGVRTPGAAALAADGTLLSLHGPPAAEPRSAAALRLTRPRAPPSA